MNFKNLTIIHNHGVCVLENGTVGEDGVAKGTCTGGGDTERFLWATSYKAFPTGVEKEWPLYSRTPREIAPGEFYVDTSSCG